MNQPPAVERRKQVLTKRVVTQRPVVNNSSKKATINTIISSANINNKKVTVEGDFFTNIDQIILDIKNLTTNIKIDSYFESNINYNSNNSIKSLFNKFIADIKNIEVKKEELEVYNSQITTKIEDINNKSSDLDSIVTRLSVLGNKNTNANVRSALKKVKPTIDNNKNLRIELNKYKTKVTNEVEDSGAMIENLKYEFKEVLYNKIINHYNKLIPRDIINLNINRNTIIPNLIKLKEIITNGKKYLDSINEKISMSLGNGNNYNLDKNTLNTITEKIKLISNLLNKLETDMKDAIKNLKDKTTADITGIKNRIKEKTEKLIQAIRDCILKIKNNKNNGLEKIKSELKVLEGKFTNDLFTNFKNIFKEDNNVVALEKKLNSILSGMQRLFENAGNNGKNNVNLSATVSPVVQGILGRDTISNNKKNNTTIFLGKKYRNFKNNNELKVGQTYLWNGSQKGKYRTGTIDSINKNGKPTFKNLTMYQNIKGSRKEIQKNPPTQVFALQGLKNKQLKVPI